MAKHALKLCLKLFIFFGVMLLVGKTIPYDGFINALLTKYLTYSGADTIATLITGEKDPDAWYSVQEDFFILTNILISIPFYSGMILIYECYLKRRTVFKATVHYFTSTFRRGMKVIAVLFIFIVQLRVVPYQLFFENIPGKLQFSLMMISNVAVTIALYWFLLRVVSKLHPAKKEI